MWGIGAKALREFIRRYPQDLDGRNVDLITVVDAGRPSAASAQEEEPPRPENPDAAAATAVQEDGSP